MSTMPKSDAEYTDTREREIQVRRVAAASLVGTTIEWYDFLVYATMSGGVIFNRCFLAERSLFVNSLVAHGTFAAGFLCARSADFYLAISEPHRPKTSACPCPGNHGHATILIDLLPTYQQIGVAPVLLVTLRLVQGTALGGEWGGAILMANSHGRRSASTTHVFRKSGSP